VHAGRLRLGLRPLLFRRRGEPNHLLLVLLVLMVLILLLRLLLLLELLRLRLLSLHRLRHCLLRYLLLRLCLVATRRQRSLPGNKLRRPHRRRWAGLRRRTRHASACIPLQALVLAEVGRRLRPPALGTRQVRGWSARPPTTLPRHRRRRRCRQRTPRSEIAPEAR
jgi:hypothetical protein